MKFGMFLPQREIGHDFQNVIDFVGVTENAGFDFLQATDHVLGADTATRPHWDGAYDLNDLFHEQLVLFGYLAAITDLELVTAVLILPQRQTALVAKQAAQIDIVSGGRFRLGVGVGWNAVEYEALGIDFYTRGARCEEQIREAAREAGREELPGLQLGLRIPGHDLSEFERQVEACERSGATHVSIRCDNPTDPNDPIRSLDHYLEVVVSAARVLAERLGSPKKLTSHAQ